MLNQQTKTDKILMTRVFDNKYSHLHQYQPQQSLQKYRSTGR